MALRTIIAAALLLVLGMTALARNGGESIRFSSGERRVVMIELYTSEGCNSCPPADRWLSALKREPGLWRRFIPVAFHVDYWDYIGWKDRFAAAEYGHRQRQYAARGNARYVYTPGVFRDGVEWHGWRRDASVHGATGNVGNLSLVVDGESVELAFAPSAEYRRPLTAHVALLGMDVETQVLAGENEGKKLAHDFVVLGLVAARLNSGVDGFNTMAELPDIAADFDERAIVAWISEAGDPTPIQSVGGYLPSRSW